MQTLLLVSPEVLQSNPGLAVGLALLLAIVVQTGLALVGSVRRLAHQRSQFARERERLDYLVKAAKGAWHNAETARNSWNGWRKFKVGKKAREAEDVFSFYLYPHDGKGIPGFQPGQYITFGLDIPKEDGRVVRCYSLSESSFKADYYRVTIKRERESKMKPGRPGIASSYFSDHVQEGDILDVQAPTGEFFLDLNKNTPVVLMGAGVGVTPVLAMANAIAASGSKREVWFFFGCRSGGEYMLREDIERLRKVENIKVFVCFSRPEPNEVKGRDYDRQGRVSPELLKELLPSNNYDYYMCGSGPFMSDLYKGLIAWGVPDGKIHFEAFGPASVERVTEEPAEAPKAAGPAPKVSFAKSGASCDWEPSFGNLWKLAKAKNVKIGYGCGTGSCGSCLVAIKSGEVTYAKKPSYDVATGSCLTCVGRPKGDLVLDA